MGAADRLQVPDSPEGLMMITIFFSEEDLLKDLLEASDYELSRLCEIMLSPGALFCFEGTPHNFSVRLHWLHRDYDWSLREQRITLLRHAVLRAEQAGRMVWPKTGARRWADLNGLLERRRLPVITSTKGWCQPDDVAAAIKEDGLEYQVYGHVA